MKRTILLLFSIILITACENKKDQSKTQSLPKQENALQEEFSKYPSEKVEQAKKIARSVLEGIYEKYNYPETFKKLYDQLAKIYKEKGTNITYTDIASICKKAEEIYYKTYRNTLRKQATEKAKQAQVYDVYVEITQTLFAKDCTYAPVTALYHRIDNFCTHIKNADKEPTEFSRKDKIKHAWEVLNRKFNRYYTRALQIKDECFKMLK